MHNRTATAQEMRFLKQAHANEKVRLEYV